MGEALRVLVADDERPVLDELVYLLQRDERVADVQAASSGAEALGVLQSGGIDAVFLDIAMPGLSGLDVARVLAQFRSPPKVVFVTAHDDHAVDAFDLNAVDYLLKPLGEERLCESVRRVVNALASDELEATPGESDETIPVELGGVTRFVSRSDIAYVEAHGDYVRLHTTNGESHLVRTPLSNLEQDWSEAGFVRIHRSLLVSTAHVREMRMQSGRCSVLVESADRPVELQVSRRHTPKLRDLLQRRAGGIAAKP